MAPASARSDREQYRAMIQQLMDFLNGKSDHIMRALENAKMQAAQKTCNLRKLPNTATSLKR